MSQIKYKGWSYYFCDDYENGRKCELCVIENDFNDFENLIAEKMLDRYFLLDYHHELLLYRHQFRSFPYFLCKKTLQSAVSVMNARSHSTNICN